MDLVNKLLNVKEGYGDTHLHHSMYPGGKCPHKCGSQVNYEHANLCDSVPYGSAAQIPGVQYRNGEAYDCGCNLCQSPYSVPYVTGPGGHMGDMLQYKPCKKPYCKCTDCDGENCSCAKGFSKEGFGNLGDNSLMNLLLLLIIAALVYYFYLHKGF